MAFADAQRYIADPDYDGVEVPTEQLLCKKYAAKRCANSIFIDTSITCRMQTSAFRRRALIHPQVAFEDVSYGAPLNSSGTVYFATADQHGNACSFINSNFAGVGTGIVPPGTGFTLQNR